ncbi:MAG TPA: hypothetical protein PKD37_05855 [Oligoflexia bacterium]|nr:hypothetical protein [Oligoflexia bacterium]HMP27487.1 hypothetical protein [Oligoflexia bacterium]
MTNNPTVELVDLDKEYKIAVKIASTPYATLFRSNQLSSLISDKFLWISNDSLDPAAQPTRSLLFRLKRMAGLKREAFQIERYGLNLESKLFLALTWRDGSFLDDTLLEQNEAERRFTLALKISSNIHSLGLAIGDIGPNTFWIERNGNISMIGLLGAPISSSEQLSARFQTKEFASYARFCPPEIFYGKLRASDQLSDVFSLGVLSVQLFAPETLIKMPLGHPLKSEDLYKAIRNRHRPLPLWFEEIVFKCLQPQPEERYLDAGEILQSIRKIRESNFVADKRKPSTTSISGLLSTPALGSVIAEPLAESRFKKKRGHLFVVFFLAFIILAGLWVTLSYRRSDPVAKAIKTHQEVLPERLQELATKQNNSFNEGLLIKLAASNDPVSYDALLQAAVNERSLDRRHKVESIILSRAMRLGLRRSVDVVSRWLGKINERDLPEAYLNILRALDVTLPWQARERSLKAVYARAGATAILLTCALALDTTQYEKYGNLLGILLGDLNSNSNLLNKSLPALIYINPDLANLYGDDAAQKSELIRDDELTWLMLALAERNDFNLRLVISWIINRSIYNGPKLALLKVLQNRDDIPYEVVSTIVRFVSGEVAVSQLSVFSTWYDRQNQEVLLLLCAEANEGEFILDAFDRLVVKENKDEPLASLLVWLRSADRWKGRGRYAKSFCEIGVAGNLDDDRLKKALNAFQLALVDDRVSEGLYFKSSPRIVKLLTENGTDKLSLARKISLLKHPDPEIRSRIVKSLSDVNDLTILKIISDHFDMEKDPEVRSEYVKNFWMVRKKLGFEDKDDKGSE